MGEREEVVTELRKIPGVSEKAALGMYLLGIRKREDLIGKDPVDMYAKLKERKDFYAEPCLQNMLKIAVSMVERRSKDRSHTGASLTCGFSKL